MRTFILGSQVREWIRGKHRVKVRAAMLFALREDGSLVMEITNTTDAALTRLLLNVSTTLDALLQSHALFNDHMVSAGDRAPSEEFEDEPL